MNSCYRQKQNQTPAHFGSAQWVFESFNGIRTPTLEYFQVLSIRMYVTRDSSAGRAEDCSWKLKSEILRSVVQIRLARWEHFLPIHLLKPVCLSQEMTVTNWILSIQYKTHLPNKKVHLARRIWTTDLRISDSLFANYSPPLYQLSYREWLALKGIKSSTNARAVQMGVHGMLSYKQTESLDPYYKCPKRVEPRTAKELKWAYRLNCSSTYKQSNNYLPSWLVVPVAQWIARRTSNPEAVGSSPTGDVHAFNTTR